MRSMPQLLWALSRCKTVPARGTAPRRANHPQPLQGEAIQARACPNCQALLCLGRANFIPLLVERMRLTYQSCRASGKTTFSSKLKKTRLVFEKSGRQLRVICWCRWPCNSKWDSLSFSCPWVGFLRRHHSPSVPAWQGSRLTIADKMSRVPQRSPPVSFKYTFLLAKQSRLL